MIPRRWGEKSEEMSIKDEQERSEQEKKWFLFDENYGEQVEVKEEDHIHSLWYEEARACKTMDDLVHFMERLAKKYIHDYGTICHAMAASMVAAGYVMDSHPAQGGTTGFQHGQITRLLVEKILCYWYRETAPYKIQFLNRMLYPQYEHMFQKSMTPKEWKWLQEEAKKRLADKEIPPSDNVHAHWVSIVEGIPPFGYVVEEKK